MLPVLRCKRRVFLLILLILQWELSLLAINSPTSKCSVVLQQVVERVGPTLNENQKWELDRWQMAVRRGNVPAHHLVVLEHLTEEQQDNLVRHILSKPFSTSPLALKWDAESATPTEIVPTPEWIERIETNSADGYKVTETPTRDANHYGQLVALLDAGKTEAIKTLSSTYHLAQTETQLSHRTATAGMAKKAAAKFLESPLEVIEHINGVFQPGMPKTGPQITGGGHLAAFFINFYLGWRKAYIARRNASPPDEGALSVGMISTKILPNDVRQVVLGRGAYNKNAWTNTVAAARMGLAPRGAKTIFPSSWDIAKVSAAIVEVLNSPESVVVGSGANPENFYLRKEVAGVQVMVAVMDGQVMTAFPAWRQSTPSTVWELYAEKTPIAEKVRNHVDIFNKEHGTHVTPRQMVDAYLGKNAEPQSILALDRDALSKWLNRDNGVSRGGDFELEEALFDYIEINRMIRDFESR